MSVTPPVSGNITQHSPATPNSTAEESADRLPLIFDGHNDVLTRLLRKRVHGVHRHFLDGDGRGHLDLPRMRAGGLAGGLCAIWVPSPESDSLSFDDFRGETYDMQLPSELSASEALPATLAEAAVLLRIARLSEGEVTLCRTVADIRSSMDRASLAVVMHLEGADGIDSNFYALEVLHAAGLRSLGPVWSRPTRFAHGVPFRFPGSPDTGPGLTDLGVELIRECNRLRLLIDLSHLNEKGFWDVNRISTSPLVATHSNAHQLCPNTRNLTDDQLRAIRDSDGLVGVNFATSFLRSDGQMNASTPLDDMLRHMDHLIGIVGESRVALGSDFDGAVIPESIADASGLPRLRAAMRAHGYDETLMKKLCHENWLAVLERIWGS